MLCLGVFLWLAFIVVEWRFAKLPIVPCKSDINSGKLLSNSTLNSTTVQKWSFRQHSFIAKLAHWVCILGKPVLHPNLLPKH
jgi:hypothetical protein